MYSTQYIHVLYSTQYMHVLYSLPSIPGNKRNSVFVVKIAPPVKVWIMDNVIVKDNKASRESLDTANSKITRTRLTLASFWIRINFHKCQSDGSFNVG